MQDDTFEPARSSFPVDCALMQQTPPALRQVLPAKHSAIFDLSQGLWLHLVVYVSESRVLLMEINQRVDLNDGVFNQTQSPGSRVTFDDDGLGGRGREGNGIFVAAFEAESIRLIHLPREGSEGRQSPGTELLNDRSASPMCPEPEEPTINSPGATPRDQTSPRYN
ncbi:hypothetical protein EYF80_000615 [Liparis tanakae]|uniref:Uncharacterized protein n=1 Tax=Liparis tanakae TaxID=230148 RepID=A0A4Z2JH98_9TELE|nr:hypothetical protein EYF80_000615 [Liparis tanakae]